MIRCPAAVDFHSQSPLNNSVARPNVSGEIIFLFTGVSYRCTLVKSDCILDSRGRFVHMLCRPSSSLGCTPCSLLSVGLAVLSASPSLIVHTKTSLSGPPRGNRVIRICFTFILVSEENTVSRYGYVMFAALLGLCKKRTQKIVGDNLSSLKTECSSLVGCFGESRRGNATRAHGLLSYPCIE